MDNKCSSLGSTISGRGIYYLSRGWHSNLFCTPIFVLGQGESQGTTAKKSGWSKVKLSFGWTRVNLAFYVKYRYYTS